LQAVEIDRRSLPEDHPSLATHLNNLALLYQSQGRYSEAEPLFLQAVEIDRLSLPEDHPSLAIDLNNLARLYRIPRKVLGSGTAVFASCGNTQAIAS
jgi:tetratricopeptide (TPR) repeat protein